MENSTWKTLAIVFIILFTIETLYLIFSFTIYFNEEDKMNQCFYEICEDNVEAYYEYGVCTCYDWNENLGKYEINKTEYLG